MPKIVQPRINDFGLRCGKTGSGKLVFLHPLIGVATRAMIQRGVRENAIALIEQNEQKYWVIVADLRKFTTSVGEDVDQFFSSTKSNSQQTLIDHYRRYEAWIRKARKREKI